MELGWGLPWARSDALHPGSRMEEARHGATRLEQCQEPRGRDTVRVVRGLAGGKEGRLPERGLGGLDGIVSAAMQCRGSRARVQMGGIIIVNYF